MGEPPSLLGTCHFRSALILVMLLTSSHWGGDGGSVQLKLGKLVSTKNKLFFSQVKNTPVCLMLSFRNNNWYFAPFSYVEIELTESLLADHWLTGLTGLTLTSFVDSFNPKWVLLFFLQALQLVLSQRNIFCDADPFLTPSFLEFNNIAFNLCPTIMFWSGPC